MDGHYFVSYSRVDAPEFALHLADKLEAGPPPYRVWLDVREMQSGRDWDRQLKEAIQACTAVLFVMTDDSVRDESGSKLEWVWALKYKKPVIPVRLHAGADLPFRLGSRQFIDFSDGFDRGLARLRNHLRWTGTPEGVLQELRERRADAEHELPRADPAQRRRIEEELEQLDRRIEEQRRLVDDPQAAREQTERRIATALEGQRQPERPAAPAPRAKFVNPPPMTAPGYFQDRHVETARIGDFLRDEGLRLMSVVGRGGVGKTAMVCRLLKALERGRLPDDLGELAVDGIVYLSPRGGHPINFPNLFTDLCRLLPPDAAGPLLERYRDPHGTPEALMRALLGAFPAGRTVVLLDNFEDLVDAEGVGLTDAALEEALRAVLAAPEHGVKVILTTRLAPRNLMLAQPAAQARLNLDEGLESPHAEELLRRRDPDGRLGLKDAPDTLLAQARERTRGFPRALEALAGILAADRDATLPELLADTARMPENVVEALVGEAFNRLDALAQRIMQALAIYTFPVPPVAVDYLLQPYQPAIDSAPVLSRLVNMQFVRRDAGRYYLHQVDRDYALHRLPAGESGDPYAEPAPFSQYALRERAGDYFQQTRTPRETWRNLDDLAPQLAEFELRSQAGDYDTAARVLFDIVGEYLQVWGHYRLALDLHERLQGHLTDPWTDAVNLLGLGDGYMALGEFRRAFEACGQALDIAREIGDRYVEGGALGGLGNGYFALGEVRRAIEAYGQALDISREIGDRLGEGGALNSLGSGYYELGESRRALEACGQALDIAREFGDRYGEGGALTGLGSAYFALGESRRALEAFGQALDVSREIGDRSSEAIGLNNLGGGYSALGEFRRALEAFGQALDVSREIGDRRVEAADLTGLGECYFALGEVRRAIEAYGQALDVSREIGDRRGEAIALIHLGGAHAYSGTWTRAIQYGERAVRMADDIGLAQGSSEGRVILATSYLHAGELDLARTTAQDARGYDYAPMSDNVALVLGIALARQGHVEAAQHAFRDALNAADALLVQTPDAYDELDNRALALCGLALVDDPGRLSEASTAFRAARAITRADGIVGRVLRLFDALAPGDETGILHPVRRLAAGYA